jgi:hypothetical protein
LSETASDDQCLKEKLRAALLDCALTGETVTYNDLAQRTAFPGPQAIHRLTELLEAMIREDHAAGRPLLAALAVSRAQRDAQGKSIPGRGFFQLLNELGRYHGPDQGPEAAAHHAEELEGALAHWKS